MTTRLKPEEGYATSNGFKMHYLEWGEKGRSLVVLHSMMMDAHAFDIFSRSMAMDTHVLAIDLLGHGESDKPTSRVPLEEHMEIVRGVVRSRRFSDFMLIGHSVGGYISMVYAAKHPDEVSRLVLVDIAPRDPTEQKTGMNPPSPSGVFSSKNEALEFFTKRFPRLTPEYLENRMTYGIQKMPDGKLRLKASAETINMLREVDANTDLWPYLKAVKVPILLIKGTESQIVPPKSLELMKELGVSVIEVPGATHLVPQDRPKEFEKAVRQFIAQ